MASRNAKPRDILLEMKELDANTHVMLEDIRNEKKKIIREELGGKTRTREALSAARAHQEGGEVERELASFPNEE